MPKQVTTPRTQSEPIVSLGHVWKIIHPAICDTLREVDRGICEARWWTPVRKMDIEILKRTAGIILEGVPFEPDNCMAESPFGLDYLSLKFIS